MLALGIIFMESDCELTPHIESYCFVVSEIIHKILLYRESATADIL